MLCANPGSLIKQLRRFPVASSNGFVTADFQRDVAFIGSLNRYMPSAEPSVMLAHGFGVKRKFAIVSSVAHDRHSPIYLGTDPEMIAKAMNMVIRHRGGLAVVSEDYCDILPLPICGLMSDRPLTEVAELYARMEHHVATHLTTGRIKTALMLLSFLGLIVIPDGGVGDDGLYLMTDTGPAMVPSLFAA